NKQMRILVRAEKAQQNSFCINNLDTAHRMRYAHNKRRQMSGPTSPADHHPNHANEPVHRLLLLNTNDNSVQKRKSAEAQKGPVECASEVVVGWKYETLEAATAERI